MPERECDEDFAPKRMCPKCTEMEPVECFEYLEEMDESYCAYCADLIRTNHSARLIALHTEETRQDSYALKNFG